MRRKDITIHRIAYAVGGLLFVLGDVIFLDSMQNSSNTIAVIRQQELGLFLMLAGMIVMATTLIVFRIDSMKVSLMAEIKQRQT